MQYSPTFKIVLASSSPYRRELLSKLFDDIHCIAPCVDESPLSANEPPRALAERLALLKAQAVEQRVTSPALIIGSDQVVSLNGQKLGKPGSMVNAIAQLKQCSGQWVEFHTGLTLINTENGHHHSLVTSDKLRFRHLNEDTIKRYIEREQPLDCAGSIKTESLGIALIDEMSCQDPNHLIGLPLIALCTLLEKEGVKPI